MWIWQLTSNRHCSVSMRLPEAIYVSSFFTKGKTASWKKMVKDEKYIQGFQDFGMAWEITQKIFEVLVEFVCKIYGFICTSVNKVRSKMFTKRFKQEKRQPDLSLLPPCQSVLKYDMQQAVYVPKIVWLGFCG